MHNTVFRSHAASEPPDTREGTKGDELSHQQAKHASNAYTVQPRLRKELGDNLQVGRALEQHI